MRSEGSAPNKPYARPRQARRCLWLGAMFLLLLLPPPGAAALSVGAGTDPAPGRSPGPPHTPQWCDDAGGIGEDQAPDGRLGLQLGHPLFATSRGLLPGLTYTVTVTRDVAEASEEDVSLLASAGTLASPWAGLLCQGGVVALARLPADGNITFSWSAPPRGSDVAGNVTFRILFTRTKSVAVEETFPLLTECELYLSPVEAELSWLDFPEEWSDCRVHWPGASVLVTLLRLNVACGVGGAVWLGSPLCGKLQELPASARTRHLAPPAPPLGLHGRPRFSLRYRLVDACYNVLFTQRNASISLEVGPGTMCAFHVMLPFGQRVHMEIWMEAAGSPQKVEESWVRVPASSSSYGCKYGALLTLRAANTDAGASYAWQHCAQPSVATLPFVTTSPGNSATLMVHAASTLAGTVALRMRYEAEPDASLEASCGYGWVMLTAPRAACVTAIVDERLGWTRAEQHCRSLGGHLLSVTSEAAQAQLDRLLLSSHNSDGADAAYWIGATDHTLEGDFRWSDGQPFSYSNWFPGWPLHNNFNRQPNDDTLSEQDCVEVRRTFALPAGQSEPSPIPTFMWNDRACVAANAFVCSRARSQADEQPASCRRTLRLGGDYERATVASPAFPRHYPDNADCLFELSAPPGYRILLDFEELVLEDEPSCGYDYLEVLEVSGNSSVATRRLCGDWSAKLKKLRYVSQGQELALRFVSDYSHHFGGFKARVSTEQALECADDRLQMFNSSCYLFITYPQVTWQTAQQTCQDRKAELASVLSAEEQSFITASLRNSADYSTTAIYWIGGQLISNSWMWTDGTPLSFTGWLLAQEPSKAGPECLAIQWLASPTPAIPSGLYWQPQHCSTIGGYVCKRINQVSDSSLKLNRTVNGSEGFLTSPNFPGNYAPNLDYWIQLSGPERTRLIVQFTQFDLEQQPECLYDYVELRSIIRNDAEGEYQPDGHAVWCGRHDADKERLHFVSESNEALLHFHTDYSVSGSGFSASWQAIDVSGCPLQTLTAREGSLTSPNYPNFLMAHLDCATTILAPGKRVWIELEEYDMGSHEADYNEALLELDLGGGTPAFQPFRISSHLTDGVFLSSGERLQVRLRTADHPKGTGFKAVYRTVTQAHEERIIQLSNGTTGALMHLNFPRAAPPHVDFITHFIAPPAHTIILELHHVTPSSDGLGMCPNGAGIIEVSDNYADSNGTWWFLCETKVGPEQPITITSYLNTLHVRQRSTEIGVNLNGSVRVLPDEHYKLKMLRADEDGIVESCNPNPCLNGGRCLNIGSRRSCQCTSHYTGMFCALTLCEREPCLYGQCHLTEASYTCHCQPGYTGINCERKQRPCADNPCSGHGECVEQSDTFHCRCYAWWEGQRCERPMLRIPYKPLSERMLQEPFWLGLITVTIVLALIGLVWCAKRHFPEKLEKLLAEEADRNRSTHARPPSVREQLASGAAAVVVVPSPQPGCPRSLLGRLGIRKPSLLSLTSPHGYNSHPTAATARTFSLDDLLKPPPRRTPSPRKKRNNSTPTKKNAAEKKQILQQLITQQPSRKVSLGELIQLSERKGEENQQQQQQAETAFSGDAKLEKKVTFARLLSKVSAEMSSGGSDVEAVTRPSQLSGLAPTITPTAPQHIPRSASSPHSTSSNQGSDSMSSIEASRRRASGPAATPAADAILAMFRTFTRAPSPSTASSPQEEDDASSTSSVLSSSITVDSPPPPSGGQIRNIIEVPVLDALSTQRHSSNLLHPPSILLELPAKCLSPITEMPTPAPSPALTPIMSRSGSYVALPSITITGSDHDDSSEDRKSECRTHAYNIPLVTVQQASPTRRLAPRPPGSPPPQRRLLKELDKPNSLDLPCPPPIITVTCNMSEAESDGESGTGVSASSALVGGSTSGMCYLSPFSMCSRADRTASESNLSSSGYSSMASPGPSRCGSNNPLCPSEVDEPPPPGPQPPSSSTSSSRRPSPLLLLPPTGSQTQDHHLHHHNADTTAGGAGRGRSDSETLSDDLFMESNDEGIGTDHLEEKIDEGELKSAKELEVFIGKELLENGKTLLGMSTVSSSKSSLQLPSITIQGDCTGSPVSSRSESPLSDKAVRFSPLLYGRDSDGLYDCASSDCRTTNVHQRKSMSASRRHRRSIAPQPPMLKISAPELLDVPVKEKRKQSPKRSRVRAPHIPVSTSSSSESLDSARDMTIRLSSSEKNLYPDKNSWTSGSVDGGRRLSIEASGEDTGEDASSHMLPKTLFKGDDLSQPNKKVSRLRTIGHQIRFLRRLELSLKRRECLVSPSDSLDEDEPQPLHKSSSYGQLQPGGHRVTRHRRSRRHGGLLVPQVRVASASGGHSN